MSSNEKHRRSGSESPESTHLSNANIQLSQQDSQIAFTGFQVTKVNRTQKDQNKAVNILNPISSEQNNNQAEQKTSAKVS